tara:strand:- start:2692 stop:2856 length:165 start_codon:yes stop_codon:yes gene_type:complete
MITKEEAQALLQIIGRGKFEGSEIMVAAQLIQKLSNITEEQSQAEVSTQPLKKK